MNLNHVRRRNDKPYSQPKSHATFYSTAISAYDFAFSDWVSDQKLMAGVYSVSNSPQWDSFAWDTPSLFSMSVEKIFLAWSSYSFPSFLTIAIGDVSLL